MIVRTSKAREASFKLLTDVMLEQPNIEIRRWFLLRDDLKRVLINKVSAIHVMVAETSGETSNHSGSYFIIREGKTQRGKKYIEIGCKRFVGVNRTRLINWAKGAK